MSSFPERKTTLPLRWEATPSVFPVYNFRWLPFVPLRWRKLRIYERQRKSRRTPTAPLRTQETAFWIPWMPLRNPWKRCRKTLTTVKLFFGRHRKREELIKTIETKSIRIWRLWIAASALLRKMWRISTD